MTSAYLTRQCERWTRPDAHLFVRPDWRRFVPRDAADHPFALYERKYRPDQPRVPAGNSDGGQWTADGGGGGSGSPGSQPTSKPAPINDPRVISDATPDNDWKPGAQYAQVEMGRLVGKFRWLVDGVVFINLEQLLSLFLARSISGARRRRLWPGQRMATF